MVEFTAVSILKCDLGAPLTDPYIGSVVLLTGFEDGPDGSTSVTDESPAAHGVATVSGNAQIDTAQFKFGASSGLFDGSGDDFSWGPSADWYLTNIWTIEFFVRFSSIAAGQSIISQWSGAGVGSENSWMVSTQASGALQFFVYDGVSFAVQLDTPTSSITTGAWYHVAIDSNGTKVRLYINGTPIVSQTPTSTTAGQPPLAVILGRDLLGGRSFNGWLDEVRITKGIARYNTDSGFAAPTAAFPRL